MSFSTLRISVKCVLLFFCSMQSFSHVHAGGSDDGWNQYRGPNRNGISLSRIIPKQWGEDGPELIWKRKIGVGFSGISVSGQQLFTMFAEDSSEFLGSFDQGTGLEKWRFPIGKIFIDDLGNGPRATPTIDGDLVFALSSNGDLFAVHKNSGQKVWHVSLKKKFQAKGPRRGFSTAPLIQQDLVIVYAGGGAGMALIALDKSSGTTKWTAFDGGASHSSPIAAFVGGKQHNIFAASRLVEKKPYYETVSISNEGKTLWTAPALPGVIAMPVFLPPDKVFVSGSNDDGCSVIQIIQSPDSLYTREVWKNRNMKNHFNSSIYFQNYLYGFNKATLTCLDARTGDIKWRKRGHGKGALILAGNMLMVLSDRGKLSLIKLTGDDFETLCSAQVMKGKSWTSPTYINGKFFARNQSEMVCYDLAPNN